ncbi:MAG: M14 family zinc carboxypeptidase [Bdellovibrionota bacterium]
MIHLSNWKKSALGTPIALHASAPLEQLLSEKPILLMGGIHGDEPEGVRLAEDTLQWLKSHKSGEKTAAPALCPWILIPCLNVDGLAKKTRVNGRGVDLNRNYPSRDWSAEARAERYFPGTGPASEPEIQAVVELLQKFRPRLVIHCHSWKPCIVGTGPLSKSDSARLARSSGYDDVDEIGYPTPGSLSRYAWHDHKIPVICIEEQEDLADLATIWPRFRDGMKAIFEDLSLRDQPRARPGGP